MKSLSPTVQVRLQDHVATVTIHRPEVMNALDLPTLQAIRSICHSVRFQPQVRLLVFTGAGEKAFSAGADLKERAAMTPLQVREYIYTIRETMNDIETLPQPVIAAINGIALGGGTELALAADIRVAARHAQLGLTETRLAIIPGAGGTQRLSRLIGAGRAKELIFTARVVNAEEALQIGLINRVVPGAELMPAVEALAEEILRNGPVALQQAKYVINYGVETELHTGLAMESKAYEVCIPTADRTEALQAFREKRSPQFRGE
ncbi:enoyl-CoA hydratase-related protein [Heliomicrobium gestii]|uniref:enoyl-CoA hydratase-related protein n=1 Tax=Heliomicrobium gestii TaxID=2699 RepID=UPI00195C3842|nr:enoyl-CoA hydratase-related protein [Heliomicrobium gestii]MBM7867702.1 enoyl-CoA hydratase/carnithine racemase [Heliomicrobium gestii]